ncbi:MAG: hypothetical protein ACTSWV_00765 [Candidatus Asgardarchaeia archaeon]
MDLGILDKLKGIIFGKKGLSEEEQKEALSRIIEASELMETRVKYFGRRAHETRISAKEALRRNDEEKARQLLSEWYYNLRMEETYRNISFNLRQNLDLIRRARDMKVISEAFNQTRKILSDVVSLESQEDALRRAVELRVMGKQVDASMKIFAKRMGFPIDMEASDIISNELKSLQAEIEAEAISGLPTPEVVEAEEARSEETKSEEEKIEEILKKLKKEVSEESKA